MKSKTKLVKEIEPITKTIALMPNSGAAYFKRGSAYIELDKLNANSDSRDKIKEDLKKAIEIDEENSSYKATLMEYYANIGLVQEAVVLATQLQNNIQSNPQNILDMSSQQVLHEVLKMEKVWQEAQSHPEILPLISFLAPYVIKVNEHEIKITQANEKILEHDKRFDQDEAKLNKIIFEVTNKLPSLVSKEEMNEFMKKFDELNVINRKLNDAERAIADLDRLTNTPEAQLNQNIDNKEAELTKISPQLLQYASGFFKALETVIETAKVNNSDVVDLTPSGKPIDNILSKIEGPATNLISMIPIAGSGLAAGISGAHAARNQFTQKRFEHRLDNFNSATSEHHPIYGNKNLYHHVLEEIQSKSSQVIERVEFYKEVGKKFYKVYSKSSPEYKAFKKAGEKADNNTHHKDANTAGWQDGFKLVSDVLKHPEINKDLFSRIQESFESFHKLNENKMNEVKKLLVTAKAPSAQPQKLKDAKVPKVDLSQKHTDSSHSHKSSNPSVIEKMKVKFKAIGEKKPIANDTGVIKLSLDANHNLTADQDDTNHPAASSTDLALQGAFHDHSHDVI